MHQIITPTNKLFKSHKKLVLSWLLSLKSDNHNKNMYLVQVV